MKLQSPLDNIQHSTARTLNNLLPISKSYRSFSNRAIIICILQMGKLRLGFVTYLQLYR